MILLKIGNVNFKFVKMESSSIKKCLCADGKKIVHDVCWIFFTRKSSGRSINFTR
jgi:hypothetical protein